MTKIIENTTKKDMRLHIQKAHAIIELHLPFNYTDKVLEKFPKDTKVTFGTIRNVKKGLSNRLDVLNALVEVALENKLLVENFKKLTA